MKPVNTLILGARGYVGGELLRLIAGHPHLELAAALSRSGDGSPIADTFPHLRLAYGHRSFDGPDALDRAIEGEGTLAVFAAAAHGESAALIDDVLSRCESASRRVVVVDTSADFRFADLDEYQRVYGEHGAPDRLREFACAVPDLVPAAIREDGTTNHRAQPGCFTTAVTLGCAPLLAAAGGCVDSGFHVSAVTGSTGSGRLPKPTTHHPERHSGMNAYSPLTHRHEPEMQSLLAAWSPTGERPPVAFVPHSGPFARGIHATIHATLREPMETQALVEQMRAFYDHTPFVEVSAGPPKLKEVVGSHLCRLGVAVDGQRVVVFSAIDNLVRGSAGGAVHWMNIALGFPETAGLLQPGMGWN